MSCCLKNYAKKTIVLTPQRPQGAITSLTPLTPELAKLEKIEIMEDFINRSYTKKELGLMYFPESMPRTAVNHLMSWIRRCQPLWDELQEMGYEKTCKSFTPKQVKAIFDNLGEPGYQLLVINVNLAGDGPAIESLGTGAFSMLNVKC